MKIIGLSEFEEGTRENVGNKAYSLMRLKARGENVPDGVVLPVGAFEEFLKRLDGCGTIGRLLGEIEENPIYGRRNLSAIREQIMGTPLPEKQAQELAAGLERYGIALDKGVSVRSSSVNEDAYDKAFAGVYTSYIDITDKDGLEKAVRSVWASGFSETAFLYGAKKYDMAVIVQQMVRGDWHGVVFTKAPDAPGRMYAEISGEITGIVDGRAPSCAFYAARADAFTEGEAPEKEAADAGDGAPGPAVRALIASKALELEEKCGTYCDIEFAVKAGTFYLLQCRPVAGGNGEEFDWALFSQDDEEKCGRYYLGPCTNMYVRYLGKQNLFRRQVRAAGFSVYRQYYAIVRKGRVCGAFYEEAERAFADAEFVIVEFGRKKDTVLCRREEICRVLRAYEEQNPRAYTYARIGEIIRADISGYASLNTDGDVFAEYVPARMQGIQKGDCPAAQAILRQDGCDYICRPQVPFIETIDPETGRKTRKPYGRRAPELSPGERKMLITFTKALSASFPNARLEWYLYRGRLYGKDISVEQNGLEISCGGRNVLSKGSAAGPVFVLRDLELLDGLAEKYNLSLFSHSVAEDAVREDEALGRLKEDMCRRGKPVIFAERPSVGIMAVMDSAAGMVFRQGAVLSHVGICLREKKIPAVLRADLFCGDLERLEGKYAVIGEDGSLELRS